MPEPTHPIVLPETEHYYATVEDVQRRMPQFVLTSTTKPTIETADVLLTDTEAQVDGVLATLGYVVPLSGENALKQVREIVCQGCIARILYARAAAIGTEVAVESADRALKAYTETLKLLADDDSPVSLNDAPMTGAVDPKTLHDAAMGLTHDANGNPIVPRITMDTIFGLLLILVSV